MGIWEAEQLFSSVGEQNSECWTNVTVHDENQIALSSQAASSICLQESTRSLREQKLQK